MHGWASAAQPQLTGQDLLCGVRHMRSAVHAMLTAGRGQVTLLKLLRAYDEVLTARGLDAEADTHYYRLLLQLSLDPSPDWWERLRNLSRQQAAR